jgi:hypothetical protein
MASKTDISNLALGRVGAQRIMDINDTENKSARLCKLFFDDTVREVGRSGDWNCLKARDTFARLVTNPAFGWSYQYQLPVNCLRVIKVNGTKDDADPGDEFEVEKRLLLTDADICRAQFTEYTDDTNQFDALFTDAVVVLLASKLAVPLRQDGGAMAQTLFTEYERIKLPKARVKDGGERKRRRINPAAESRWIAARVRSTND